MSQQKFIRVMTSNGIASRRMVLRDFMDYYGTLDANGLGSQLRRLANLVSFGSNQFKSAHGGVDERENFENVRFGW
jgi:hypothetical protein